MARAGRVGPTLPEMDPLPRYGRTVPGATTPMRADRKGL